MFITWCKISNNCIMWPKKPEVVDDAKQGFDHGVGHPLLLLGDAKAPNFRKNNAFNDLGHYSAWPKVTDAVIKAHNTTPKLFFLTPVQSWHIRLQIRSLY